MPSNGTEGMAFVEHWCERCAHESFMQNPERGHKCGILTSSFLEDEIPEWIEDENGPRCIKFSERQLGVNKGGGYRRLEKRGQLRLF